MKILPVGTSFSMRTDTLRAMKNQIATFRNFAKGPNAT